MSSSFDISSGVFNLVTNLQMCYAINVVKRTSRWPLLSITKEGGLMKNNDFISLSSWLFSLVSLLIAFYMLGKGM